MRFDETGFISLKNLRIERRGRSIHLLSIVCLCPILTGA
jgi:hypothetical protein